jgi:hypothetical protein
LTGNDPSLFAIALVTITVTDVNETPVLEDTHRIVAETSALGDNVGAPLVAIDPDAGDTITYSITGGTGSALFAIGSTSGQITVADDLDYETTTSYTLVVKAQDVGTLFDTATVTIYVQVCCVCA